MATIAKHIPKIRKKHSDKKKVLISIPKDILDKAVSEKSIEPIEDYLENWELARNPAFIREMKRRKKEALSGKSKTWDQIQKELGI